MDKRRSAASVRRIVEFALLSGDLSAGAQMAAMREGTIAHKARQQAAEGQSEVTVRCQVEGEIALLQVSGRIDLLYERDGVSVVEEIKLGAEDAKEREAPIPVHRAQAVCYGHMLGVPEAVIRVAYVRMDGSEIAAFEETMTAAEMEAAFFSYVTPFLADVEERMRWTDTRDASIRALRFPFHGYREGQREMAVQAYWAIKSKKRLFAQAPTGIGKTAAALYPALKALGEGLTGQLFYLTARTTGQKNAMGALASMRREGLRLRVLNMTAKEKVCPGWHLPPDGGDAKPAAWRCDVLTCPGAIGFFDRLPAALSEMRGRDEWSREAVAEVAAAHRVCPFEFALSLCEEADAVVCDYNYAFDPGARIRRVFLWTTNLTLLVDEAHNMIDRSRAMLSAELDSRQLRGIRRDIGNATGRKGPLYRTLTALIARVEKTAEGVEKVLPEGLARALEEAMDAAVEAARHVPLGDLTRTLIAALGACERFDEHYAVLTQKERKHTRMTLYCLNPAPYLQEATRKLRGTIFFSATMTPLPAWRTLLGSAEEDGMLSLLSPFPRDNLLVLRHAVPTTYRTRERSLEAVADAILAVCRAQPGNYLACFPSYAYLRQVREAIEAREGGPALHVQQGGMDDAAREAFLSAFVPREDGAMLAMVVMGGIFGEGVDLPGELLSGAIIVGVGLPQICPERELLRAYYDERGGDGFDQAYRYPGMNKVLQAVGRVIRTETDRGVTLLVDERFLHAEYAALMPPWWHPAEAVRDVRDIEHRLEEFWR